VQTESQLEPNQCSDEQESQYLSEICGSLFLLPSLYALISSNFSLNSLLLFLPLFVCPCTSSPLLPYLCPAPLPPLSSNNFSKPIFVPKNLFPCLPLFHVYYLYFSAIFISSANRFHSPLYALPSKFSKFSNLFLPRRH